nr:MAG TPA: hypothetical protein [Inoviridae sp.]
MRFALLRLTLFRHFKAVLTSWRAKTAGFWHCIKRKFKFVYAMRTI